MNCPDIGTLRASLDDLDHRDPAAEGLAPTKEGLDTTGALHTTGGLSAHDVAEHVKHCEGCRETLAELRRAASLAAPAVGLLAAASVPANRDVEAALERTAVSRRQHAASRQDAAPTQEPARESVATGSESARSGRIRTFGHRMPGGVRAAAAALAVAAAIGTIGGTPAGRSAAAGLLAQFRSEELAVVTFDPNDPGMRQGLSALDSVGRVNEGQLHSSQPERVDSLAEASQRVGFPVRGVEPADLPAGADRSPTIMVTPARQVTFTFDRERAERYIARHGGPDFVPPAGFDGAKLVVQVPAAAAVVYDGPGRVPGLVAAQAGQIRAHAEGGPTLAEMRDFLLDIPGLPEDTVSQLRGISDWRTTLPVLVPVRDVEWERTTVGGTDALMFGDPSSALSAVVWQRDGRIYGVGGPIDSAEALRVAGSLE